MLWTIYCIPPGLAALEDNISVLPPASKTIMEACVKMDIPSTHDDELLNLTEYSSMSKKQTFPCAKAMAFGDCSWLLHSPAHFDWHSFQSEAILRSILHRALPGWPHTSPWFQPLPMYWRLNDRSAECLTGTSNHIMDHSTQLSFRYLELSYSKEMFSSKLPLPSVFSVVVAIFVFVYRMKISHPFSLPSQKPRQLEFLPSPSIRLT